MIRYTIRCTNPCKSKFEGVFPDKESFVKQRKQKMIICPMCDGSNLRFSKISVKKATSADQSSRP